MSEGRGCLIENSSAKHSDRRTMVPFEMRSPMGEQAFPDEPMQYRSDTRRKRSRWRRRVALAPPAFFLIPCLLALVSCAATDDQNVTAQRARAARELSEKPVWKSALTQIEPQIMASARPAPGPAELDRSDQDLGLGQERTSGLARSEEQVGATGEAAQRGQNGESNAASAAAADPPRGEATTGAVSDEVTVTPSTSNQPAEQPIAETHPWLGIPDKDLVRELLLRTLKRWEAHAGGFSDAARLSADDEEQELARGIVTLSFLSDEASLDKASLEAAAGALSASGNREDLIRAALGLQQLGKKDESDEILRRLTNGGPEEKSGSGEGKREGSIADPPAESAAVSTTPPSFELVSVSFASRIDGPGDFVAMPKEAIQPGKDVLIYGEFTGFRTVATETDSGDRPPLHSRAFSATLQLLDADTNELEVLDFLPRSRGRQSVENREEPVNFWARYRIPQNLDRGRHTILITAEDHLGSQTAKTELSFDVE